MTSQPDTGHLRRAVVTGVSSGIGAAVTTRLLNDGWTVIGLSRRKPDFTHDQLSWRECDLSDSADLLSALEAPGPIDAKSVG